MLISIIDIRHNTRLTQPMFTMSYNIIMTTHYNIAKRTAQKAVVRWNRFCNGF